MYFFNNVNQQVYILNLYIYSYPYTKFKVCVHVHTTGHFFQTVAQANNIVEKTAAVGVLTNSSGKLPVRHRQRQIYFCPVVWCM